MLKPTYSEMKAHIGHNVQIVQYDDFCVSIECEECNETLIQFDGEEEYEVGRLDFDELPY